MRALIEEVRPLFCFSVTFILIFCILFLLTNFKALLTAFLLRFWQIFFMKM